MGTICLQCGDRGFTNAFVYCVKCLNSAVHRYCLDVIPETFDEFVHWACDDCEDKAQNQSAVRGDDAIPSQTRNHTISKNIKGFSDVGTKKNDVETEENVFDDGPKQLYDTCTELDLVECGETTNESALMQVKGKNIDRAIILSPADESKICQQNSPQQLVEEKANGNLMQLTRLSESTPKKNKRKRRLIKKNKKNKRRLIESNEEKEKDNKGSRQKDQNCISLETLNDSDIDHGTAENHVNACNGPLRSSKKKKKKKKKEKTVISSKAILKEQIHRTDSAQPLVENKGLDLVNQCADMKTEERNNSPSKDHIKNGESKDREEMGSKDLDISCAEPVVMPIWRGSFDIWNEKRDILDGLIAHLSIKACQKVYEEACQFQPVLHLEMLPLSDVWPKSFETLGPRGDNIALYFFPSEISERDFDHLVEEMMSKELALKAFVQNAELLIFASNELPLLYWRFQHKYYLWGVFRAKQSSPSNSHPCQKELEDKKPIKQTDKTSATTKKRNARSPCSPLSNSASDGSGTPIT